MVSPGRYAAGLRALVGDLNAGLPLTLRTAFIAFEHKDREHVEHLTGFFDFENFYPDYEVRIAAPVLQDGAFQMPPGRLDLVWYAEPSSTLIRERRFEEAATVSLFRDGMLLRDLRGQGRLGFDLGVGAHQIVVRLDDTEASPGQVRVTVKPKGASTEMEAAHDASE